jgi:hypothetical protein
MTRCGTVADPADPDDLSRFEGEGGAQAPEPLAPGPRGIHSKSPFRRSSWTAITRRSLVAPLRNKRYDSSEAKKESWWKRPFVGSKTLDREQTLQQVRLHRRFEKPSAKKRRKMKAARFAAVLKERYADL